MTREKYTQSKVFLQIARFGTAITSIIASCLGLTIWGEKPWQELLGFVTAFVFSIAAIGLFDVMLRRWWAFITLLVPFAISATVCGMGTYVFLLNIQRNLDARMVVQEKVDNIQLQKKRIVDRIQDLEGRIGKSGHVESVEKQVASVQTEIEALSKQAAELNNNHRRDDDYLVAGLNAQLAERRSTLGGLQSQLTQMRQRSFGQEDQLLSEQQSARAQLVQLEVSLKAAEDERAGAYVPQITYMAEQADVPVRWVVLFMTIVIESLNYWCALGLAVLRRLQKSEAERAKAEAEAFDRENVVIPRDHVMTHAQLLQEAHRLTKEARKDPEIAESQGYRATLSEQLQLLRKAYTIM